MDIRCGNCSKLFRVADEKISGKGIRFKCSKCGEVITVTREDLEMDLLAREGGEEGHPFRQEAAAPPKSPAPPVPPVPSVPPVPPAPEAPAEPEAREYKPPPPSPEDEEPVAQEYKPPEAPSAGLEDFDFSAPDVAAQHAQEPGGAGVGEFSLGDMPEAEQQEAAGELSLSEEDARAAEEDAFSFPVDMISEPKQKAAFAAPSDEEQAPEAGEMALGEPEPAAADTVAMPQDMQGSDAVPDLGEPSSLEHESAPAHEFMPPPEPPAEQEQEPKPEPVPEPVPPKGPVISPELLAQMKKASASRAAAAKQEPVHTGASDEIDLGAALAIPKGAGEEPEHEAASTGALTGAVGGSAGGSGKRLLVIGVIAVALVAVLAALYFLGFLWGKREQAGRQAVQQLEPEITPEGLTVAEPMAYVDPEKGDLVITGKVQNGLDRTKPGWYLVINVTDGSERTIAKVRMVNGIQIMTARDRAILAKRGVTVDAAAVAKAVQTAVIPARGSVTFEARLYEPPAGIAGFLPVLGTFDPGTMLQEAATDAAR